MKWWVVLIIVIVVIVALLAILYFLGRKAQKKQEEQQEIMQANKQYVSMLIIDKKRMKLRDAGLPAMILQQTPKALRGAKLPIIKAKIGQPHISEEGRKRISKARKKYIAESIKLKKKAAENWMI